MYHWPVLVANAKDIHSPIWIVVLEEGLVEWEKGIVTTTGIVEVGLSVERTIVFMIFQLPTVTTGK